MKKLLQIFCIILFTVQFANSQTQQLWGLASQGGATNDGTMYTINSDGTGFNLVYSFVNATGSVPVGTLLEASDGKLYIVCYGGGIFNSCTISSFDRPTGTYTDEYDFDLVNGDFPSSGLLDGGNGKLYGVAAWGGMADDGVLYSLDLAAGSYTKEYDFYYNNGQRPRGTPLLHSNGKLYGLTYLGGLNNYGVIYSYDIPTDTYTKLLDFSGTNGSNPYGSLIELSSGILYGMTSNGGANNQGTIFSFDPATGTFVSLHSFNGADGASPQGTLMQAADGKLYGTTSLGGVNNVGALFNFDLSTGTYTKFFDFVTTSGKTPLSSLMQASNQKLFGTASAGGINNAGVIFSYDLTTNTYTNEFSFNGTGGRTPDGSFIVPSLITGGMQRTALDNALSVYPNPVKEKLFVRMPSGISPGAEFNLYNVFGEKLFSGSQNNSGSFLKTISMNGFAQGVYFLEIINNGERLIKKVTKE